MASKPCSIKVVVLKKARWRIRNRSEARICYALNSSWAGFQERQAADQLATLIMGRLHPRPVLEGWLRSEHGVDIPHHWSDQSDEQRERVRITRLAWIDDMIREFS